MAVTTTATKVAVIMKLQDGTSVSLGSLNKDAFDAEKVMNIVGLLAQMFAKSLYLVQKTEVSDIEAE